MANRPSWLIPSSGNSAGAQDPIAPNTVVRYIKLGESGSWERECLAEGLIRFGFGSSTAERFPLCTTGKWEALTASFIHEGKDKGTATRFTNETRHFFEDNGSILWITFMGECLHWGLLDGSPAVCHEDGQGVYIAESGTAGRQPMSSGSP